MSKHPSARSQDSYLNYVFSVPNMEKDEETKLFREYRLNKNKAAFDTIIGSHLKLVVSIAQKNRGYGISVEDLVQEGTIGLLESIDKFDTENGSRFCTYCVYHITSKIREYILKNYKVVKMATTKPQEKAFYNLSRERGFNSFTEEQVVSLSKKLNISPKVIRDMECRMFTGDQPFDTFDGPHYANRSYTKQQTPHELLYDLMDQPDVVYEDENYQEYVIKNINIAINKLDKREKDIINSRVLGERKTLKELSEQYGVSGERIRQIYIKTLAKLHNELQTAL